jgi:hypothetical protein
MEEMARRGSVNADRIGDRADCHFPDQKFK